MSLKPLKSYDPLIEERKDHVVVNDKVFMLLDRYLAAGKDPMLVNEVTDNPHELFYLLLASKIQLQNAGWTFVSVRIRDHDVLTDVMLFPMQPYLVATRSICQELHLLDVLPGLSVRNAVLKLMVGHIPGVPQDETFYQILPSKLQYSRKQGIKVYNIDKNGVKAMIIVGVKSNNWVIGDYQDKYYWQWHELLA